MIKALTLKQFVEAFPENYDRSAVYYADGKWIARVMHGQLTKPDGTDEYDSVEELLRDLASVGIRKIEIEWDGLPASGRKW